MRILKRIWIAIIRLLRFLFHFRKPAFTELDVNDWVVAEKPLALIRWQMRRRYSIFIAGTSFHNNQRSGLFLVALPEGLSELSITLRSGWRKRVYGVALKKVSIPEQQLKEIVTDDLPVVKSFRIAVDFSLQTSLPLLTCQVPRLTPSVRPIHVDPFLYNQPKPSPQL